MHEGLLEELVSTAIWLRASDIHFDPEGDQVRLIYRIHGKLISVSEVSDLPIRTGRAILQRLKVLSKLQLGEQRKAQDGHLRVSTARGDCDMRVAVIPTLRGERAVARLFPCTEQVNSLTELGMPAGIIAQLRLIQLGTGGLVLVSGKIGAGKSTTLHSLLWSSVQAGLSVITIEDPIERHIPQYHQMAVDERQGWTFSECLRAALRQDPDWLMVGEVRDRETAQIAARAGMTGHLIVATVHADHPLQAVNRLLELGVSQSFVLEAVRLVIWQKLFPLSCENCSGGGCENCSGVGRVGRRAEFLALNRTEVEQQLHRAAPVTWRDDAVGARGSAVLMPLRRRGRGDDSENAVVAERSTPFAPYGKPDQ